MAFEDDIATDFLGFDGTIPVTLIQNRGGQKQSLPIRAANQSPLTYSQIQALSGVSLNGKERNWNINATDVGAGGVSPGDQIDDGTNLWSVLLVTLKTLGVRWVCTCRQIDASY